MKLYGNGIHFLLNKFWNHYSVNAKGQSYNYLNCIICKCCYSKLDITKNGFNSFKFKRISIGNDLISMTDPKNYLTQNVIVINLLVPKNLFIVMESKSGYILVAGIYWRDLINLLHKNCLINYFPTDWPLAICLQVVRW